MKLVAWFLRYGENLRLVVKGGKVKLTWTASMQYFTVDEMKTVEFEILKYIRQQQQHFLILEKGSCLRSLTPVLVHGLLCLEGGFWLQHKGY